MRIAIGSDHAGFSARQTVRAHLQSAGHELIDVGTHDESSVDYPDFAKAVGEAVRDGVAEMGVLFCGTGIGVCIAANKVHGIRAAQVSSVEMAQLARQHNNANVVCAGARLHSTDELIAMVDAFLATSFEGGRHAGRVAKIMALES
ncbi:MAG: ribose 5-phosphate isomerase B [Planctomycetota bacterium]